MESVGLGVNHWWLVWGWPEHGQTCRRYLGLHVHGHVAYMSAGPGTQSSKKCVLGLKVNV